MKISNTVSIITIFCLVFSLYFLNNYYHHKIDNYLISSSILKEVEKFYNGFDTYNAYLNEENKSQFSSFEDFYVCILYSRLMYVEKMHKDILDTDDNKYELSKVKKELNGNLKLGKEFFQQNSISSKCLAYIEGVPPKNQSKRSLDEAQRNPG